MPAAREYRFQQYSGGRGAIVRIGPQGGSRLINVYKDQDAAQQLVDLLNRLKHRES